MRIEDYLIKNDEVFVEFYHHPDSPNITIAITHDRLYEFIDKYDLLDEAIRIQDMDEGDLLDIIEKFLRTQYRGAKGTGYIYFGKNMPIIAIPEEE